jgi:hypothetical protein
LGLERVHQRFKAADKELTELVAATETSLMNLHGIVERDSGLLGLAVTAAHQDLSIPNHLACVKSRRPEGAVRGSDPVLGSSCFL